MRFPSLRLLIIAAPFRVALTLVAQDTRTITEPQIPPACVTLPALAIAEFAAAGAFTYHGQVGDLRAPWMGCWLFVREHPTFAGLPANRALKIYFQADGKQSNGLLIERADDASDPEIIMGYSRDQAHEIGAASFLCRLGKTAVLVHRAPAFSPPLQQRWLANSISYLAGA